MDFTEMNSPSPLEANEPRASLETMPSEILQHIFSYLLLAANLRIKRNVVLTERHYRFHTAISLVNRTIGLQASAFLYRSNIFALVRYERCTLFENFLDRLCPAPIVSCTKLENFKHHAILIEIARKAPKFDANDQNADRVRRFPFEHLLVLHKDLPGICSAIQLCNHDQYGGKFLVTKPNRGHPSPHEETIPTVRVLLHNDAPSMPPLDEQSDLKRQAALLKPFQELCGGGTYYDYRILGSNHINRAVLAELHDKGHCFAVSVDGIGWDLIKHLRRIKTVLDRACRSSYPMSFEIGRTYHFLYDNAMENIVTRSRHDSIPDDDEQAISSWQLALVCFRMDAMLTAIKFLMRGGDCDYASSLVAMVLHHYAMYCFTTLRSVDGQATEEAEILLEEALDLDPGNRFIQNDIDLIQSHRDALLLMRSRDQRPTVDLSGTSVSLYPVVFNTETGIKVPDIPRLWRGTEEMLSDATIEQIETRFRIKRGHHALEKQLKDDCEDEEMADYTP